MSLPNYSLNISIKFYFSAYRKGIRRSLQKKAGLK